MKTTLRTVAGRIALSACIMWTGVARAKASAQTNSTSDQPAVAVPAPVRPNTAIIPGLYAGFMKAHPNTLVSLAQ